jgi:N-acyl-D-amino-acid deacylase
LTAGGKIRGMRRMLLAIGLTIAAIGTVAGNQASNYDILVTNGRILDGSGNPWLRADVAIKGDRIVAVGRLAGAKAALVVDAHDRVVAPGFMDVHSHALGPLTREDLRDARALIAQGLTTILGNPDGGGPIDLKQQAAELETGGIGVNAALVIGHATVRNRVLGQNQRRDPTPEELDAMRALVRQAVADGAFGLSSGLFYTPGRYAKTEEVIALAREAGGVYTSHIRDEGDYDYGVVASVDEVIRIADEAHVRGVVSHIKALGPDNWGKSATMIAHIDAARARGIEVFADQYPYEASSTSLAAAVMPGENGNGAREAMDGPESKRIFLGQVKDNIRRRGGPASIVIASGRGAAGLAGKNLDDIAKSRGVSPEQAATDIVIAGGASIVSFNMNENDIDAMMRQVWTMGSSDGSINVAGGGSLPHPRGNGAFARRIARYVTDRHVVTLEHAVRTMTSLPAHVFGFVDRGEIRPGAFADIVIFDPARVRDRATYTDPFPLAEGIDWVIVNGVVERKEGEFTGAKGGNVLKKPTASSTSDPVLWKTPPTPRPPTP